MADRTRPTRRLGVGLVVGAFTVAATLGGGASPANGSASFTVAYTPDDGGDPITQTASVDRDQLVTPFTLITPFTRVCAGPTVDPARRGERRARVRASGIAKGMRSSGTGSRHP